MYMEMWMMIKYVADEIRECLKWNRKSFFDCVCTIENTLYNVYHTHYISSRVYIDNDSRKRQERREKQSRKRTI